MLVWVSADAFIDHTAPQGWASTIVVVLFMDAVQLVSLGIIGEYIRLIFLEVKQRPTYRFVSLIHAPDAFGHR